MMQQIWSEWAPMQPHANCTNTKANSAAAFQYGGGGGGSHGAYIAVRIEKGRIKKQGKQRNCIVAVKYAKNSRGWPERESVRERWDKGRA